MRNIIYEAFPQDTPPEIIYHYTTRDGLLGIVKERAMWASDLRYLNDSREFEAAVDLASKVLPEVIEEHPGEKGVLANFKTWIEPQNKGQYKSYICSFSENGDSLSQWRGYTKAGDGYAIGIDTENLKKLPHVGGDKGNLFLLGRCRYEENEQKELLKKTFEKAIEVTRKGLGNRKFEDHFELYCLGMFLLVAPLIKDKAFKEEREWRFVSVPLSSQPEVAFRSGKSMLIPYISFDLGEKPFSIKKVFVGPGPHDRLDSSAVLKLLNITEVGRSNIPFRDW